MPWAWTVAISRVSPWCVGKRLVTSRTPEDSQLPRSPAPMSVEPAGRITERSIVPMRVVAPEAGSSCQTEASMPVAAPKSEPGLVERSSWM